VKDFSNGQEKGQAAVSDGLAVIRISIFSGGTSFI
jgi:hypothetical protein